jgi:PAS domain S-box-containing protein
LGSGRKKSGRMKEAPIPKNEKARLAAVRRINLSRVSRATLNKITKFTADLFNVPISTVTVVDYKKEKYVSVCGLRKRDGSRAASFCGHAIAGKRDIMIVPDTLKDPRFKDNPMVVKEPRIRFYAGVVLKSTDGYNIGTLCIKDKTPRVLNKKQIRLLKGLGDWVQKQINFLDVLKFAAEAEKEKTRLEETRLKEEEKAAIDLERRFHVLSSYNRSLIEASLDPLVTVDLNGKITDGNKAAAKIRGLSKKDIIGTDFANYYTEPEKARELCKQAFVNGSVLDYQLTLRSKNGKLNDLLYNASAYKDEKGNVVGILCAARNVTGLKKAEEVTQKHSEELERLNKIMVGRELRMVELKQEIARLKTLLQQK